MSHRAALYRVRIRPQRDVNSWRLLGDYDEAGSWAGTPIDAALVALNGKSRDGKVHAKYEARLPALTPDRVGVTVLSGRSGVTSVLERPGDPPFSRTPDHSESMRSAALFHLPPDRDSGWLAIHVPHGKSCKGIVENQLRTHMSNLGYVIELGAIVPPNAIREAVERDAVERITLIKHEPSKSDRFKDAAQWGDEEVERIELSIPSRRRRRLRSDPLQKFLDEPTEGHRKQIIEFGGLQFDEAAVTVDMPEGGQRTFYLEAREGGHPMTLGLDLHDADEYGVAPPALAKELQRALETVTPSP